MALGVLAVPGAPSPTAPTPGTEGAATAAPTAPAATGDLPGVPFLLSDGGAGVDADNNCVPGRPPRIPLPPGRETHGVMTPVVDPRDHYRIDVNDPNRGITVRVVPSPLSPVRHALLYPDVDLVIRDPGCALRGGNPVRGNFGETVRFVPGEVGAFVVQLILKLPGGLPAADGAALPGSASAAGDDVGGDSPPPSPGGADCHPPCDTVGYVVVENPDPTRP